MPLASGEVFAEYRIQRLLGAGGMGEVYLVQHPRLPRLYALKVLPSDAATDSDYRSRFNREADLAADLYHPNIVGVHDRGEFNGQLWIAMDYVEGSDCDKLLRQRYPAGMPTDQALEIITAVAEALDYAHQRGLLHRDVKPANILLTQAASPKSRILLADFGIARQLGDAQGLTATNMVLGTVNYAAPEQLMGEPLDGRADQYALAVTAYQLLTGTVPFQSSNPAIVISHKLNRDAALPALSSHNATLSPLDPVFAAALANAPASRFKSCSDFASALVTACGRSQTSAETRQRSAAQTMPAPVPGKPVTSVLPAAPADRTTNSVPAVAPSPRARPGIGTLVAAGVLVAMLIAIVAVVAKTHAVDHTAPSVSQPAALTFDSMKNFVTAHYDKLPANTADTWSELDDHYKNRTGREAYDEFWATIKVVKLLAVRPRDANSVTVTLKYFKKNGDTDTEDRWLSMVLAGDKILIHDSERVEPTIAANPPPATPIVGEVPGEPAGAAALRPWVRDLVSLSTAALAAKCWTIAPDSAKRMYADQTAILNAVRNPGGEDQYGDFWSDETTRVSARESEIRSGYACPYVEPNTGGDRLSPNDAEYVVQRYLARVTGKPVSPNDVESKYSLESNNLSDVAKQLLGKVTSFDVTSIRSNGDREYPVVTVTVDRAGSASNIHVSLSDGRGIDGCDGVYCIANSD